MSYKEPQPIRHVPAAESSEDALRPGDPLGAFVGYLRRPKSSASGLTAQFFGENGQDADVISALHLSRFLDAHVKVSVWMIKDRTGRVMRKDGAYLKLTEFIASIRRPQPSALGQVAQFFGDNGPNSDAINVLNQSLYQDALVYVEMHQSHAGMTVGDIPTDQPTEALEQNSERMTTMEAHDFKKLQKQAQDAMKTLVLSGFFRQESVLTALGREVDFQQWLSAQTCCHPGQQACDNHPVAAWAVPSVRRYGYIPLCTIHSQQWDSGTVVLPDSSPAMGFAQTQSISSLQRWAQQALSKQLNIPIDRIPTPRAVYSWALEKKVEPLIPNSFKAFLV